MSSPESSVPLPDPSELLADPSYNPIDHPFEFGRQHIARIPGHPEALLRWYPHCESSVELLERNYWDASLETIKTLADRQEQHLKELERQGVRVVDRRSAVLDYNPTLRDSQQPTIFNVVRRIDGQVASRHMGASLSLPAKLIRYALDTKDDVVMSDVFRPYQHMIEDNSGQPVLHDIEPDFENVWTFRRSLYGGDFKLWAERVETAEDREQLRIALGRLSISIGYTID